MRPIVSKFGGSSTASAERFRQILSIVRQSHARRCVVLSAPGADEAHAIKVTSLLDRCWQQRKAPHRLEGTVAEVVDRFGGIAGDLSAFDIRPLCAEEIGRALYISRDHTLSRGEYLCAALVSAWSGFEALDAAKVVAFDAAGRLDEGRTLNLIREATRDAAGPVVLPGFYGADPSGRIVTFPRNGSDITGALAAAAMEAGLYENWTDVPGLMTADPAVVPGARLIRQISYRQMRRLARAGARVLHPACLDPVAQAGIPTRLRCTGDPGSFGTLIDDHCVEVVPCLVGCKNAEPPRGCEEKRPLCCVTAFGLRAGDVRRAARRVSPVALSPGRDCTSVYALRADYGEALRMLHRALLE